MKKIFALFALVAMISLSKAQNTSFTITPSTSITGSIAATSSWIDSVKVNNLKSGPLEIEWEMTSFSGVNSWNYQVCDHESCIIFPNNYTHDPMAIAQGDEGFFKFYIYSDDTMGTSSYTIAVWEKSNRENTETEITVNVSPLTAIDSKTLDQQIQVFPTVVESQLFLASEAGLLKRGTAMILDLQGRILQTKTIHRTEMTELNVSDLSEGIFFLRYQTGKATVTRKFLKH